MKVFVIMIAVITASAVIEAEGQSTQGLRVEIVHRGSYKGTCIRQFYTAVEAELFDFAKTTAATILQQHDLSIDSFEFSPFHHLGSVNVRTRRLRGDDRMMIEEEGPEQHLKAGNSHREMKTYSTVCRACTSKSCSAYCSGCYLCSSGRKLSQHDNLLAEVKAALQDQIEEHFMEWMSDGAGASLDVGCMGNPRKLRIDVSLV